MFSDLNDFAKKEFLKFQSVENESNLNCDTFPIAIIELEEEDEEKKSN